jgi:hypothetical protein
MAIGEISPAEARARLGATGRFSAVAAWRT